VIVSFGQAEASPYIQAAEAVAARYRELNAATPYPATLYPLSREVIDQLWGTAEARQNRINVYLRYVSIYDTELRRGTLGQQERRDTDGHYAGVVIRLLQRKFPAMEAGTLLSIGAVALDLIAWTRARYPEIARALVCDVILAMNGYFGIELEEPEEGIPSEGIPSGPEERAAVGNVGIAIGVAVVAALIIYALTRGRRR